MQDNAPTNRSVNSSARSRPLAHEFWREGDDGLFSQTWYPICLSSDVSSDNIVGRSFLDGDVVVARGRDGKAHVFSAYCVHMGANLKDGDIVDHTIRCPYHHWQFDDTGACVKTGAGDPPPPNACLFEYPSCERWGVIFAFNGEEPLWTLPDFANVDGSRQYQDSDLYTVSIKVDYFPDDPTQSALPVDPWMVVTNPLDFQHFVTVHQMNYRDASPGKDIEWHDHFVEFRILSTNRYGTPYDNHQAVYGNNCLYLSGNLDGRWFGFFAAQTIPAPGYSEIFFTAAVEKGDGSTETEQEAIEWAESIIKMETEFFMQDMAVLKSMHFHPGLLTKIDTALARQIKYLQGQPRAHPGGAFIK